MAGNEVIMNTDEGVSIAIPPTCSGYAIPSEYAYVCDSSVVSDEQIVVELSRLNGIVTITPNVAGVYGLGSLVSENTEDEARLQRTLGALASAGSRIEDVSIDQHRGILQRHGFPEGGDENAGTGAQCLVPYGGNKLLEVRFACGAYDAQACRFEVDDLLGSDEVMDLLAGITLPD